MKKMNFYVSLLLILCLLLIVGCVQKQQMTDEELEKEVKELSSEQQQYVLSDEQDVTGQAFFTFARDFKLNRIKEEIKIRQALSQCIDSDNGRNYFETGTVSEQEKSRTDYCQDYNYLFEYDCGFEGRIGFIDGCGHAGLGGCRFDCSNLGNYICMDGQCVDESLYTASVAWCENDEMCTEGYSCVDNECVEYEEPTEVFEYSQTITFENPETGVLGFYQDEMFAPNAGIYLYFLNEFSKPMFNYTLTFDSPVDVDETSSSSMAEDLEGKLLEIQGKPYSIADIKYSYPGDLTGITFIDASDIIWINKDEQIFRTIDGTDHIIELVDVTGSTVPDESSCGFLVDDQSIWVDKGTTETINGIVLGVLEAVEENSLEYQDTEKCKLAVATKTINLRDKEETRINEQKISDITDFYSTSYIDFPTTGAETGKLIGFMYNANPNNNLYLAEGDELVDPVIGGFKLIFAEFVDAEESDTGVAYMRMFAFPYYAPETPYGPSEGYEFGNHDFYLGKSIAEVDGLLTFQELPTILKDGELS